MKSFLKFTIVFLSVILLSKSAYSQTFTLAYIYETMNIPLVYNVGGPDINTEAWNDAIIQKDKALYYLALNAYLNPAAANARGVLCSTQVVNHLRNIISYSAASGTTPEKSNEPSCRGDILGWKDVGQAFALVFAKKTPLIWSQFTAAEINKFDWLMRGFAVTGNYHGNIQNWPKMDTYQTYGIGKTWNPNHNDGYVGIMIAAYYYFGGANAVNQTLADFNYDTYISTFRTLHFDNIVETWTAYGTTTYPTGANPAAMKLLYENPTGLAQTDKGGGKVYGARMPFVFGAPPAATTPVAFTPKDLYLAIASWMFPLTKYDVDGNTVSNTVSNSSLSGAAHIISGSSPVLGKIGMCREFQVTDGFAPNVQERSDAQYVWWGWMMHVTTLSAIMALGDWPTDNSCQDIERRIYAGSEDLIYKLKMGYHSFSKGAYNDHYDYKYAGQGYWYMVDVWNNLIKKRINKAPLISITAPSNNTNVLLNSTVTLTANVSDNEGYITRVGFYNGTQLLKTFTSAPYTFTISNLPLGNLTIVAKATDDDGLIKSDSIKLGVKTDLSALNENNIDQFKILPNPSHGNFNLQLTEDVKRVRVFDLKGKMMLEKTVIDKNVNLENNWQSGVYILDIECQNNMSLHRKLIKI
jgi:hypothetical protein